MEWSSKNRKILNPKLHGIEECPVNESEKPGLELEHGNFLKDLRPEPKFLPNLFLDWSKPVLGGYQNFLIPIESCFHTKIYKSSSFCF
jgi:hypothetical protein